MESFTCEKEADDYYKIPLCCYEAVSLDCILHCYKGTKFDRVLMKGTCSLGLMALLEGSLGPLR